MAMSIVRRREFVKVMGLGAAALLASGLPWPANAQAAVRRPNILFLLTDDQRYDELGITGHSVIKTANLDALAREGALFDHYFVTTASCLPNRTTLVTSQWERCHSVGWSGGRTLSAT